VTSVSHPRLKVLGEPDLQGYPQLRAGQGAAEGACRRQARPGLTAANQARTVPVKGEKDT